MRGGGSRVRTMFIALVLVGSVSCSGNVSQLENRVAQLEAENAELQAENADLTARLASATSTTAAPPAVTITGTLTLKGNDHLANLASLGGCAGIGGYDDIREGVDVVVRGPSDEVVGASSLSSGKPFPAGSTGSSVLWCDFDFEVEVPPDLDFYTVAIGNRGDITYSRTDLEAMQWDLTLSLG